MASDLHCHTKISDGSLGIEDLVSVAKRRGLSYVAVTDHDAVAGATRAVIIGRRMGMRVIHGVEFSTMDTARNQKAHLLCYCCNTPDRLEGACRRMNDMRKKNAILMIRKVMRYYPITPEMIAKVASGCTTIYKQHIMHALMDAGYTDSFFGDVYDKLFSPDGGLAYVPNEYPDTHEILDLIHSAGGIAVLAHPAGYHNEALMEELTGNGLDGIEVWHPLHSEAQIADLSAFADAHHLLKTGGSDFHGMYTKEPRPLGSISVSDDCVNALLSYKSKKRE